MGRTFALVCVMAMALMNASAQTPGVPPPSTLEPTSQAPAQMLPPHQLDNLVAPIALYPDPLLSQVLAASTYPVELVEAQQWSVSNQNLSGQQLMDAARQQSWDPSVQALLAMPNVLSLLTQDIRWTTDLGNAFLAQQADVMSAVQRMRQRAQGNGQLQSNQQENVITQDQGGQQAIEIEPANPQEIYVPSYDPYYVYGYGAYPQLYYPDGYWFEPGINLGLYFGGWGGWGGWGWGCNWFGGGLFVNNGFFNRYGFRYGHGFDGRGFDGRGFAGGRTAWAHDPGHRLGASYPNRSLNARFGAASQASRMAAGRAGNWHTFSGSAAGANSYRGTASQAGARGAQSFRGAQSSRGEQNFRSQAAPSQRAASPSQRLASPSQRFASPSQRFEGPSQRFASPTQRNAAPAQRFSAPAQRSAPAYSAPQRSFQAAPRMSAPSSGGGGARNFGGGGASRGGGGGAASRAGGGGSHGGGGHR